MSTGLPPPARPWLFGGVVLDVLAVAALVVPTLDGGGFRFVVPWTPLAILLFVLGGALTVKGALAGAP